MERLLVVRCPSLLEEQEDGQGALLFNQVVLTVSGFSPAVEVVAPGVCSVASRGPSRYFGGDESLAGQVWRAVNALVEAQVDPFAQVGLADGLMAAVLAASSAGAGPVVVERGGTPAFLAPWPVDVLGVGGPDGQALADLLRRLGLRDLGSFAALPTRHVLARLGAGGVKCHAVARGEDGEMAGLRIPSRISLDPGPQTGPGTSTSFGTGGPAPRQPGFWGEAAAAEARAGRVLSQVTELLGPGAVMVGRLQGGRGPREQARLVPWSSRRLGGGSGASGDPWPGRIPPPAPVVVFEPPVPVAVEGEDGAPLGVGATGMASAAPRRLSVDGGPWTGLSAWAGPWPADERWWSGRRRRARMQVVTASGAAYLLVRERGRWWLEGYYD